MRISRQAINVPNTPSRDGFLIPGPGHSGSDRSLSISFKSDAPDGFLVHSFAGDNPIECRAYVRDLLGLERASNKDRCFELAAMSAKPSQEPSERTAYAERIFKQSRAAFGTSVETYLTGRGLKLVPEVSVLRFHAECPFAGEHVATMVAPVVNIQTNAFQAIHRTRLNPKDKKMLGPVGGGCVKLSADEDVLEGLHICEGIETGLALIAAGFRPVWACLSANGMSSFPVLPGIEALTLFADNDKSGVGQRVAGECGARWQAAGREVRVLAPKLAGTDFADGRAA